MAEDVRACWPKTRYKLIYKFKELHIFQRHLFDLINECNAFDIADLILEDNGNQIIVLTEDGKKFKVSLSDESKDK